MALQLLVVGVIFPFRQEQAVINANIGAANYAIGHMFGASGGGGNAGYIGCVCNANKGSGITSPADSIPQGDNFDIDYVVHEVGHQMGANHSFSFELEGTGVNKEVGSGITIMGYAGITDQDVAPHSIDTFHEANIAQIQANLANKACPVTTTMTANHAPVVAPVSNYTIPISTPFALTGSATGPENDALIYQWEQNDNSSTAGNRSVVSPTKATGPNWLSFVPTASPTRLFPRLSTILAGLLVTPTLGGDAVANVEALSSVNRALNFRLTVRDNRPYIPGSTIGQNPIYGHSRNRYKYGWSIHGYGTKYSRYPDRKFNQHNHMERCQYRRRIGKYSKCGHLAINRRRPDFSNRSGGGYA